MIRKMTHMDLPLDLLHEVFSDSDAWPEWMPGVRTVRTLQDGKNHRLVLAKGSYAGISFHHEMDVSWGKDRVRHAQRKGWPVKWAANFRFITPPDGLGTTVLAELETEFAPFAPVPKKVIKTILRRMMKDTLAASRKRALHLCAARPKPKTEIPAEDKVLLSVYRTEEGLEVTLGDKRWVITASG